MIKVKSVKHELMALAEDGSSCTTRCGLWLRMDDTAVNELLAHKPKDITCTACQQIGERLIMNQVTDSIWIGNSGDAKNSKGLLNKGITAVLNVAVDLDYNEYMHKDILYRKCGLVDGPGNATISFSVKSVSKAS